MTAFQIPFLIFTILLLVGCAHQITRGEVAMKISDTEAHIGLGDKEVKPGDRVSIYHIGCNSSRSGGKGFVCEKIKTGEAEVLKTLNQDYSIIRVPPETPFKEGDIVEKNA